MLIFQCGRQRRWPASLRAGIFISGQRRREDRPHEVTAPPSGHPAHYSSGSPYWRPAKQDIEALDVLVRAFSRQAKHNPGWWRSNGTGSSLLSEYSLRIGLLTRQHSDSSWRIGRKWTSGTSRTQKPYISSNCVLPSFREFYQSIGKIGPWTYSALKFHTVTYLYICNDRTMLSIGMGHSGGDMYFVWYSPQ